MLKVFNLTAAPVTLAAGNPARSIPASIAPPARGPAVDITSELRPNLTVDPANGVAGGLTGANFTAIQVQVTAGTFAFEWTEAPEFLTTGLTVPGISPGAHATTHKTAGGTDVLAIASGTTGITAAGNSHTHTSGASTFVRHEVFKLPNVTGANLVSATAIGAGQPKVASAQPNCPRVAQVKTGGAWASTDPVVVTLTGVGYNGIGGITDAVTIPGGTGISTAIQGVKPFLTLTSITWTMPAGWTAGTFTVETGTALGVVDPTGTTIGVLKEVGYADATPTPADATTGTLDMVNHSYIPTTALDGLKDVEVWWSSVTTASTTGGTAVTVPITDAGHTHNIT